MSSADPALKRWSLALVVGLAALHGFLAVSAVTEKSPTFDEPTHFAAGYSYWLRHDFRLDPESGVLPQLWAALPLLVKQPAFPSPAAPSWTSAAQGEVGTEFFYQVGNASDALLLRGRFMNALWSIALCLLVYFWSASLFGRAGGLISAACATFCPTLLANGALVTGDVCLAFFLALATWSVWRMLGRITVGNVVLAGLCVAAAFLSKMSGALIVLIIALQFAVRLIDTRALDCRLPGCRLMLARRSARAWCTCAALAFVAAISLAAIWAAYGFRFSITPAGDFYQTQFETRWNFLLQPGGRFERVIGFARGLHLLPQAYLFGLTYVHANSGFRPAFLDGNWSVIGFPDFFLRSFFYKTPLPLLGLLALATMALVRWARRVGTTSDVVWAACVRATPVWTLLIVYAAFALTTHLNIGHRHLLPLYVPLFIACGATATLLRSRAPRVLVATLLAWHAGEALSAAPDYLSYFNEAAGGARNGYRHLVDSSLDWGQDLPALKHWLDRQPPALAENRPVYLAYFGTASPRAYGITAILLNLPGAEEAGRIEPLTAGIYCVSATTLQQVYANAMGTWSRPYEDVYQALAHEFADSASPTDARTAKHRRAFLQFRLARLCAVLRHRAPIASAGNSILIYDLTAQEIAQALTGPPAELADTPQVDGLDELEARRESIKGLAPR